MSNDAMIGTIFMFAGNFAPRGYALCQGQLLSIAQNTALFSIIGTYYGGNGQTTFALPDLRGRSPIGAGNGPGLSPISIGQQGGTEGVSLGVANLPPHSHGVKCDNTGNSSTAPSGLIPGLAYDRTTVLALYSSANANAVMNPSTVSVAGNSFPLQSEDPLLGINFLICTQGVFPSRN
jgi:microcystin-dependent protein